MKTPAIHALLLLTVAATASAEDIETKGVMLMKKKTSAVAERKAAPNEVIRSKTVSFDGVAVQCFKADNPAQLVNPFASAEYGDGEQNVSRDPVDNKVRGLKIFNVRF